MRTITQEELDQILADHALWLDDQRTGEHANLTDVDLTTANLTGVDLSGVDLSGANLTGTYLTYTNLTDANLIGADLFGADLSGVWLYGGDLTDANLTNANLTGAYLTDAKFGLNIIDAKTIYYATFSQDALMWLILRKDWAKVKDTVTISSTTNTLERPRCLDER